MTHGTVIAKGRDDATTMITYNYIYDLKGNLIGMTPVVESYVPEMYWVEVRGFTKKGNPREKKFYVSHDELDRTRIGDVFDCGAPGKEHVSSDAPLLFMDKFAPAR